MGKKSRSKKGGGQSAANKLVRKEKLKQRREQQLELAEPAPDDDYERPYFVGDRAWFIERESYGDGDNPLMYRGIVKAVDEETLAVTPLQWKFDGRDDRTVRVWKQNAFPDFADMTLRFEVGDRVVCRAETGWNPYTVDYLWPVGEIEPQSIYNPTDHLPKYRCGPLIAQHDEDFMIREHPLTFRLKTGQKAVFNTTKAISIGSNNYVHFELGSGELWIEGTVTSLDVTGLASYYAAYECAYEHNGRQYKCHITRDVDEHIAKIDCDPRSRLLESIEQDCSRNHLKYLAKEHDIDVSIFRDLVIAKAIHFASYDALCWLQFDCDVHVQHAVDSHGNGLLHQIAMHPHALRFIKTMGKIESYELKVEERLDFAFFKCRLNNDRKSWLEILVDRGNIKALDAALSPNQGLGWSLVSEYHLNDEALRLLQDAIKKSRDDVMQLMIDSFVKFRTTCQRCKKCMDRYCFEKISEDALLEDTLLPLKGGKAEQNAQLITRFCGDWGSIASREFDPANIIRQGHNKLFILFWKADARIFKNLDFWMISRENREEFCQPELADTFAQATKGRGSFHDNRRLRPDLLTFILYGTSSTTPSESIHSVEVHARRDYLQKVIRMSRDFRDQKQKTDTEHDFLHTFTAYLRTETGENVNIHAAYDMYIQGTFLKYKLNLLTSDDTVEGRIKILDHLLRVDPQFKAKVKFSFALDCIRYRQTRFLEYLIEQCYVKPNDMASTNRDVHKVASKFTFLKDGNIPKDVSVRTLLCYASAQFDDLQSLALIGTTDGALLVTCNGWNLLTFASYLGRVEIVAYLYTRNQAFDSLVKTRCQRKPYDDAYAAHIAASRGHLVLAEALLEMNCPATDRKGKTIESYAKLSEHEFARAWVSERKKPQALDRMIKKLFKFLSAESATTEKKKKYIIDSKCLEEEVWKDGEIYWHDEKTPSGFTFSQVLAQCYKGEGPEFALWLCTQTYFLRNRRYYSLDDHFWRLDKAQTQLEAAQFKIEETLTVAREYNQDDLVRFLSKPWWFLSKPWWPKGKFQLEYRTKRDVILSSINVESEHVGWVKAFFDRAIILEQMASKTYKISAELISRGCHPDELKIALDFGKQIKALVLAEDYSDSDRLHDFNMKNANIWQSGYTEEHLLKVFPFCYYMTSHWLSHLHCYLAIEQHTSLLEYCLRNFEGWSAKMEIEVVQIAAYYNHTDILDIFVLDPQFGGFLTNHATRVQSLFTGLVVRGQLRDFERYVANFGIPCDPIKDERSDDLIKENNGDGYVKKSLICTALGCFIFNTIGEQRILLLFELFLGRFGYSQENVLYAMKITIETTVMSSDPLKIHKAAGIMDIFVQDLDFDLLLCQNILRQLGSMIVEGGKGGWEHKEPEKQKLLDNAKSKLLEWIKKISMNGVDISNLANYNESYENCDFMISYRKLEAEQKQRWSNFDIIKNGSSLVEIQDMIANGELRLTDRDYSGMSLAHLAAAYNRQDLLKWLVTLKDTSLSSKEGRGRTVLDVARASKAPDTTRWIEELQAGNLIARVVQRRYQQIIAKQRLKRMANAQISIASIYRGFSTRRLYRGALLSRVEDSQRYAITWGKLILSNLTSFMCWSDLREQANSLNDAQLLDDSFFVETDKQLSKAAEGALLISDNELAVGNDWDDAVTSVDLEDEDDGVFEQQSWASFRMTSHVVKWLKQGDKKYKTFFVRRMQQLANGERSRILRKRLKGSATTIFETYLEQKSGFRILYTEEGDTKVIWFVSPHGKVSRLMKLIDEAKTRTARQQVVPESVIASLQHDRLIPSSQARREVLLDVVGNVPLKVYDVNNTNLEDIATNSWVPRLHLSDEELRVVEEPGTVLLLGRSGTGKTVCICNRMEYDRQQHRGDSTFRQLFVARSKRLTKYVSGVLGEDRCSVGSFLTYAELLSELESALPQLSGRGERPFKPSTRVDFVKFKDYYASRQDLSKDAARTNLGPLVVWTAIRSFLKNSIEAFQSPSRVLSRETFSNIGVLGKNRCRVPYDLRDAIYDEFERYQAFLQSQNLWDDCDRIMVLIQRLEFARQNDLALFESVRRSKIYVDETQDYTQLELLLFFELSGPSSLFLAGDPAQSVVEGTEFRFEEVRSVAYYAAGNDRKLVPSKPLTVNLNFRSHAGVLNVASLFLDYLFHHFPSSAKQLKKDYGLFQGSRPGVLHKLDVKLLKTLLSDKLNGAVVLCHDDSAAYWRSILDYTLVYGIREAKGLEFKAVIILNFFEELPQQRPWRNLLLGRVGSEFESKFSVIGTHLKLLYTAITRCIERLFFVESKGSVAGDAAVRRLTTTSVKHLGDECRALATRSNVHDIDAMIMTKDEFLAEGLNAAEIAESDRASLDQALASLNRAVFHFEQAGHTLYASKARTHRSSVHFRLENQSRVRNIVNTEGGMVIETKMARIMENLVKEGLLREVIDLFHSAESILSRYTAEHLERDFILKIESMQNKS